MRETDEKCLSSCWDFNLQLLIPLPFRRNTWDLVRDLSGCFSALSLVNSWSSGCDEAVLFHLCLVKAVSLLNICWPVHRRRSCFRNVKRLFAEPVRCCIRQSLCLSLRQIATSLEDSCSVLKRSVLLYTPSASETHRETEKTETRCLQRQKRYERKYFSDYELFKTINPNTDRKLWPLLSSFLDRS